ncbi:DUF2125 domain-containing protein [Maritimibacter sp. 55A14]|uniref:DUF2125 domain-containing protein n=1 Tax=Maritimibacter sp. 55A14 TaxID=2174844 RepID=UPI000D60E78E|nr:DUF2125 domain-containing protein [Maritimibacter sp. 55A14]PWE32151.1 DUF2125 domain-containing protein [Maritimibacter sp. 55A14]
MRFLIGLVLVLTAGWCGYWFVGAAAKERVLSRWFEDRRAEGWVAEHDRIVVRGFPNRFDTTLTGLMLADPETGLAWRAPFFQILALSYRPNHIIAIWPDSQTLASPQERLTLEATQMRASVRFEPGTALTLDRVTMELDALDVTGENGWQSGVGSAIFATRQNAARADFHDIAINAKAVRPSDALRRRLDPTGYLPETVEVMSADLTLGFDSPWDRRAIEEARPQITRLELNDLNAVWGRLELRAAGELDVDQAGIPEGTITVKAKNWREMLQMAVDGGVLPEGLADTMERGLAVMSNMSGNPRTLDAPISFSGGTVKFGPIPLGPAPRLRIR